MGKIIQPGKWKPVEIKVNNFNNLEGLAGFEELTEFSTVTDNDKHKTFKDKVSKKKKKVKLNSNIKVKSCGNVFTVKPCNSLASVNTESETEGFKVEIADTEISDNALPWNNIFVPAEIIKSLLENGFAEPTSIQAACIPSAIKGRRDILGAAETGSGKTLAFGIPMLHGIMKNMSKETETIEGTSDDDLELPVEDEELRTPYDSNELGCVKVIEYGPQKKFSTDKKDCKARNNKLLGLVITPTRELALQVKHHLVSAARYTGIEIAVIFGGMSTEKQQRMLKRRPHIVVATPGRLWELITTGEEHISDLSSLRFLVIDEADRMTEVNHFPELKSLLERLNADQEQKKRRQNFVFSATLSLVHETPTRFKKKGKKKRKVSALTADQKLQQFVNLLGMTNPKIVDMTTKSVVTDNLTETCLRCSFDDKDLYLYYFLQRHPGRTLVFCNNISCVRRLAYLLNILKCQPLPLHASMMQRQRLKNLDRFRDSPHGILLATDVAARGLDIPNVQHVIHYQVPKTSESYVHRSGRTARGNEKGLTLVLIEPSEMSVYNKLCKTLNKEYELPEFPVDNSLIQGLKERIYLARDIYSIESTTKKENANITWLEKSAQEMDIILDDNLLPAKEDSKTVAKLKHAVNAKRKKLNSLLSINLAPIKMPSFKCQNISQVQNTGPKTVSAIETVKSAGNLSKKKKVNKFV